MYMFDKNADCRTGYIRPAIMNTKKINIITLNRYWFSEPCIIFPHKLSINNIIIKAQLWQKCYFSYKYSF